MPNASTLSHHVCWVASWPQQHTDYQHFGEGGVVSKLPFSWLKENKSPITAMLFFWSSFSLPHQNPSSVPSDRVICSYCRSNHLTTMTKKGFHVLQVNTKTPCHSWPGLPLPILPASLYIHFLSFSALQPHLFSTSQKPPLCPQPHSRGFVRAGPWA